MRPDVPLKVDFHFTAKCNMSCRICYVPFDHQPEGDLKSWRSMIDLFHVWGVEAITFDGGEPFVHDGFRELLSYTYKKFQENIFIQVDTNGLLLKALDLPLLERTASILGIPLDGTTAAINQQMRGNSSYCETIIKLLERISKFETNIKINTVVSKVNIEDLHNIADLIGRFPIKVWRLNEFWPLGKQAIKYRKEFELDHKLFMSEASSIVKRYPEIRVELGSIEERWRSYFFVSQAGNVYAHDMVDWETYVSLGSIFDDDILNKWTEQENQEKQKTRLLRKLSGK